MSDDKQSQGRNDNDAIPESEAQARAGKPGTVTADEAATKPDYGGVAPPADPADGKR